MSNAVGAEEWSRRKLLLLLIGVLLATVVLLVGLAYAAVGALAGGRADEPVRADVESFPAGADGERGDAYRDALADEPMLQADEDDLLPAPASLDDPGTFIVYPPTNIGPAGVATGYPRTEAGAVAQLAAIEVAVLTPMTLANARDVFEAWSHQSAAFDEWELAASIRSFHAAAGTQEGDSEITVSAVPVGAQVKGTDGPDWVLACVQLDLTVSVVNEARFGFGHCSRMAWDNPRWVIAAGDPPAQAPSTWPGSQRSVDAGWQRWVERGDS